MLCKKFPKTGLMYLTPIRIANRANNDPIETKASPQSVCQEFRETLINPRFPIGGWHTECESGGTSKEDGYVRRTLREMNSIFQD